MSLVTFFLLSLHRLIAPCSHFCGDAKLINRQFMARKSGFMTFFKAFVLTLVMGYMFTPGALASDAVAISDGIEDVAATPVEALGYEEVKFTRAEMRRFSKEGMTMLERPVLAIKTNVLFDLAGIPNVEVELPIGYRVSVLGEYQAMWWLRNNSYAMQAHTYGAELRWWPRYRVDDRSLTGWFMGLFVMSGFYDIQQSYNSGTQGEISYIAGMSIGYVAPISRSFNLEFSVGVGYIVTQYRWYDVTNDTYLGLVGSDYIYQSVIPAKFKISLSWLILRKIY